MAVEHELVQRLLSHRARCIPLALGLLDDDLELASQLIRVDDRVAECVGLDVQGRGQTGGWKDGEVAGVIVAGTGVQISARGLGLPRDGSPRRAAPFP